MKSTDDTFLVSIENANEKDAKAMIIDMYYDSTVPGSYLNGEYTEGSIKLTNRRIMGINNPTTTSIFQDLMQVLETGFTIGKIALYNKELNKDEFDSEAFHKGFAVRHSTFEKDATTHLFRDGHKELTPGEYLLPFETLYLRVDVPEGYTMQDYVFDGVEQSWKPIQEGQDNGSITIHSLNEYISNSNVNQAINQIKQAEQQAISNFSSQKVSPEMLSESTKQLINASGGGTITNLADDEDIESVGQDLKVLKFANRAYNPGIHVGMGYKILRRNIIDGKNILIIKENSDRCHYYNGKWNKKDLAIGISSIILGSIAKYFITLI